jgi:hypothetical protein
MSDSASDKRSVRGVPEAEWKMATAAARRANRQIGEWLCEAIRAYVAAEHEDPRAEIVASQLPAVTPDQVVTYLHAYRQYLELRGAEFPRRGKVMQAADRMMQRAMTEAGMPPPERIRRIAAP